MLYSLLSVCLKEENIINNMKNKSRNMVKMYADTHGTWGDATPYPEISDLYFSVCL